MEPDAALGNGGLGRLAACFMESMASVGLPAYGYGIRYDHGLFRQVITDGWQQEMPGELAAHGNPWEFERPEVVYPIGFGGYVEQVAAPTDAPRGIWHPRESVLAVAFDTPVVGWQRQARQHAAALVGARRRPAASSTPSTAATTSAPCRPRPRRAISRVLYPSDETPPARSCACARSSSSPPPRCRTCCAATSDAHGDVETLPEHAAIQHERHASRDRRRRADAPAVRRARARLGEAWRITSATLNYTNHTLLPEALETWPVALMDACCRATCRSSS